MRNSDSEKNGSRTRLDRKGLLSLIRNELAGRNGGPLLVDTVRGQRRLAGTIRPGNDPKPRLVVSCACVPSSS